MPSLPPYRPIDCSYYDRIETAAVRRAPVTVRFKTGEGDESETVDRIVDVFSRDKAEFLRLGDGREIRLDQLLALDGVARPQNSGEDEAPCAR